MSDWFKPRGTTAAEGFDVTVIRPGDPGWAHTGLLVADLADGESRTVSTGECEYIVLPLSGAARVSVTAEGYTQEFELAGRKDVFSGPTDLVYVPRDAEVTVTSVGGGRYAWPSATARSAFPVAKIEAKDVPVELRGAGQASRQVQNFGTPGTLEADSIIACEVITPAGNWSSYPPHKHDEERPGEESSLEEIYYFEMRAEDGAPEGADPMGYQRVYGTDDRPIDVLAEVRSGDTVLVPHGWHGPAMAPTGYDMYYLNVMAGPGEERVWLICDDPAHGWVRDAWPGQDVDPRLPLHEKS
ncbi:5-deoxy-glucuronate isomerase [Mobilicoccus massiliensis]|uniref:5-deoxy-glucuronate isomerase n=1 Tax=Mobilicoccus massiliensis TaxID=1522310 RepID=UPI00058C6455|nr:5-deoxy-glucuronate isomerase [Mobilicoccus massiliensis]